MSEQPNESLLEKVRNLIALSENEGATEAERESALAMADKLMTKHAIDRALLEASAPEHRTKPVHRRISLYEFNGEFHETFIELVGSLAGHYRLRAVRHIDRLGDYTLVGYPEDVEYFEMVWTSVYLAFISRMVPGWNPADSEDTNIYRLKEAGVKWERIAHLGGFDWPDGGKLKRAYRRECIRLGVTPTAHTQRHNAYRASYAQAFVARIGERTYRQTETRRADVSATPGAAVALRDRSAFVEDLLYELFPELRPPTDAEMEAMRQRRLARQAAEAERVASMTPAERAAYEREQAKQERANARWYAQYQREQAAKYDSTGARAGRAAADQVDLSGGRNSLGGKNPTPIGQSL